MPGLNDPAVIAALGRFAQGQDPYGGAPSNAHSPQDGLAPGADSSLRFEGLGSSPAGPSPASEGMVTPDGQVFRPQMRDEYVDGAPPPGVGPFPGGSSSPAGDPAGEAQPKGQPTGVNLRTGGSNGAWMRLQQLRAVPPEYHGGHLMPVGRDELEAEWARIDRLEAEGRLTELEADQRRDYLGRNWEKWQRSPEGLSALLQKQQAAAQGRQVGYQLDALGADAQTSQQMAERQTQLVDDVAAREQEREIKRQASIQAREAQTRAWQKAQAEADGFKIDPDRYMKRAGSWNQARFALAAALSSASSALTGGPNTAVDMLERRIDRDLDAQRQELQSKRGAAEGQRSLLATMRQHYADDEQAYMASKRFLLDQAALELRSIADSGKPEMFKRRASAMADALESQREMLATQQQLAAEIAYQQQLAGMLRGGGVGGKPKERTTKQVMDARAQARRTIDVVNRVRALRESLGLKDWASETFDWVPGIDPTDATKEAMAAQRELMQASQVGVLTNADEESLGRFVPGGMTLKEVMTSPDTRVLESMRKKAEEALRAESASDLPLEYVERPVTNERERRKERDK